jgi:hypothetical protein
MAHAKPQDLQALQATLDELRGWPRIREPRPNIFYLGSKPFLHFHTDGARLWADIKRPDGEWAEVPAMTKPERAKFLKRAERHYSALARSG